MWYTHKSTKKLSDLVFFLSKLAIALKMSCGATVIYLKIINFLDMQQFYESLAFEVFRNKVLHFFEFW